MRLEVWAPRARLGLYLVGMTMTPTAGPCVAAWWWQAMVGRRRARARSGAPPPATAVRRHRLAQRRWRQGSTRDSAHGPGRAWRSLQTDPR